MGFLGKNIYQHTITKRQEFMNKVDDDAKIFSKFFFVEFFEF